MHLSKIAAATLVGTLISASVEALFVPEYDDVLRAPSETPKIMPGKLIPGITPLGSLVPQPEWTSRPNLHNNHGPHVHPDEPVLPKTIAAPEAPAAAAAVENNLQPEKKSVGVLEDDSTADTVRPTPTSQLGGPCALPQQENHMSMPSSTSDAAAVPSTMATVTVTTTATATATVTTAAPPPSDSATGPALVEGTTPTPSPWRKVLLGTGKYRDPLEMDEPSSSRFTKNAKRADGADEGEEVLIKGWLVRGPFEA